MSKRPVQPSPPGWYDDPYEVGGLRYFDGRQWTERTEPGTAEPHAGDRWPAMEVPDAELPPGPAPPRPRWLRTTYTVVGVLAVIGLDDLALYLRPVPVFALLFQVGVVAIVAPRASYRRVAGFAMLIPVYNVYLLCRIAWRLTCLPYRDWEPRPEEAAGWRRVRHPTRPDELLYLPVASGLFR